MSPRTRQGIKQNDKTAIGMVAALQTAGYRIPEDISVVGFDGIPSTLPQLTTVEVPLFDMGQTAVQMLCEWIDNPTQIPQDVALPGRLIIGDTSALSSATEKEFQIVG
ncbi:MAG: LacI family transcriptional regulator [Pedobacter sp.]|nr:MAG: LacI family transcriptional regulator [Pedobacter sp.]